MGDLREQSRHRPTGIFDVRDLHRERQTDDGLAATVPGPIRITVDALGTPAGRVETPGWQFDTRRSISGLAICGGRVVEHGLGRTRVRRTLPPSTTSLELRVWSPSFQSRLVTLAPATQQYARVDLLPGIDYPFSSLSTRPDEPGPSLLRGGVLDEASNGVPACAVTVPEALYDYDTGSDGAWVLVVPDAVGWVTVAAAVPYEALAVTVTITLTPGPGWQSATVISDPDGPSPWSLTGLVATTTVQALRGATASVPALRLRLV